MTLYELTGKYRELYDVAAEGEWDETSKAVLEDILAQLEGDIEAKLLGIARVRQQMRSDIDALKAEENRLSSKRKGAENAKTRLEAYAYEQMEYMGLERVQDATHTVAIQNNPPSVSIEDERKIDARWWLPQPAKLDKAGIHSALKEGELIEGAELIQGRGVRFR